MPAATDEQKRRFDAAAAALGKGDWRQAQRLAADLVAELPSHAGLHFIAGAAALELGHASVASGFLARAAALNPKRADYLAQLARALTSTHMRTEAMTAAEQALSLSPVDPMTLDVLGAVYSRLNEYAKAAQVFQRLVDSCPGKPGYHFNLATSLIFTGD
ncbi:MAG TPA: sulfotransferase, partial [Luteimonas sp.]|nr:sulfotransferase [Luteimonas sp.]